MVVETEKKEFNLLEYLEKLDKGFSEDSINFLSEKLIKKTAYDTEREIRDKRFVCAEGLRNTFNVLKAKGLIVKYRDKFYTPQNVEKEKQRLREYYNNLKDAREKIKKLDSDIRDRLYGEWYVLITKEENKDREWEPNGLVEEFCEQHKDILKSAWEWGALLEWFTRYEFNKAIHDYRYKLDIGLTPEDLEIIKLYSNGASFKDIQLKLNLHDRKQVDYRFRKILRRMFKVFVLDDNDDDNTYDDLGEISNFIKQRDFVKIILPDDDSETPTPQQQPNQTTAIIPVNQTTA